MRFKLLTYVLISACSASALAEWQPHRVKQSDGNGDFIYYEAQKNVIGFPNGGPTSNRILPTGLVRMDNGTIALAGVKLYEDPQVSRMVITFSENDGETWSDFQTLPGAGRPMMLTYLGDGRLSYRTEGAATRYFSNDYGQTWPETAPVPQLEVNGRPFRGEGNNAVDFDADGNPVRVMEIGFNWDYGKPFPRGDCTAEFRYSLDGGRTWQGEVSPPNWKYEVEYKGKTYPRGVCESSVVRAENGWLVAALRTDVPPRFWKLRCDNLMGTAVSISKDNGRTWSPLDILYDAGRHHANLQLLPNGDLLMTLIKREDIPLGGDELASHNRGLEALISHDNGLTWNSDKGFILDEFEYCDPSDWKEAMCGHLASTALADGSVLSVYGHHLDGSAVLIKWNPNATIPEPSSLVLLAAGLVVLLCYAYTHRGSGSKSFFGWWVDGGFDPAGRSAVHSSVRL